MLRNILLSVACLLSSSALASPIMCDGAKVEITFEKSLRYSGIVESILTASRDGHSTILRYDGNIDFIGAECRKTNREKSLIVFQAFCGGSGCKDLDNFGIIDPKDLRVLLVPNDWNRSLAKKIFGSEVAPIEGTLSVGKAYDKIFHQ